MQYTILTLQLRKFLVYSFLACLYISTFVYLRVEAELRVDLGGGLLQDPEGLDDRQRHPLRGPVSDGEVEDGAASLGSVVLLIGNLNIVTLVAGNFYLCTYKICINVHYL